LEGGALCCLGVPSFFLQLCAKKRKILGARGQSPRTEPDLRLFFTHRFFGRTDFILVAANAKKHVAAGARAAQARKEAEKKEIAETDER
jgi:hypothetical protein